MQAKIHNYGLLHKEPNNSTNLKSGEDLSDKSCLGALMIARVCYDHSNDSEGVL